MNSDWQARTHMLMDDKQIEKLADARVLVTGLGGVGSWAAEHLARTGIGNISIVDNDTITPSNINRQLPALHSTIGKNKAEVLAKRLQDINPALNLSLYDVFITEESLKQNIPLHHYDYVLDCIDTLTPKINLIQACLNTEVPHISSLGSAGKTDPSAVKMADISKSYNCTLGRMLRKRLHKINIYTGFKVVFSSEKTDRSKVVLEEGRNKKSNAGTISALPSIFGAFMAAEAINHIRTH